MNKWMTVSEAAVALEVTERTIHSRIKAGRIESKKEDGNRLVFIDLPEVSPEAHPEENGNFPEGLLKLIEEKDARISDLQGQIEKKDEQIDHLQQLLAIQSQATAALTEQIDAVKALEDMRSGRSWWQRLFSRSASATK